jgi:hypothetical protein
VFQGVHAAPSDIRRIRTGLAGMLMLRRQRCGAVTPYFTWRRGNYSHYVHFRTVLSFCTHACFYYSTLFVPSTPLIRISTLYLYLMSTFVLVETMFVFLGIHQKRWNTQCSFRSVSILRRSSILDARRSFGVHRRANEVGNGDPCNVGDSIRQSLW